MYVKLCRQFRAFIRCIKTAFYRSDYQKFLMCTLIKTLGWAFISKHSTEPLKISVELLNHSTKFLKHAAELLRLEKIKSSVESLKSWSECLKRLVTCLCYNTAHTVPISHGIITSIDFYVRNLTTKSAKRKVGANYSTQFKALIEEGIHFLLHIIFFFSFTFSYSSFLIYIDI